MNNLTPHNGTVSRERREEILRQRGGVVWFTGLSGSGKSTVARAVEECLAAGAHACYVLDGDTVRTGLCADLGFSPADRGENIRRVAHVAALMADAGLIVLCAFISPYREHRDAARALLPPGRFIEVHVRCPLEECERRDVKGLYRQARQGGVEDFTGIHAPYEEPLRPDLVLDTGSEPVDACAARVTHLIEKMLM